MSYILSSWNLQNKFVVQISSNINEVIKAALNFLFFLTKRFRTH